MFFVNEGPPSGTGACYSGGLKHLFETIMYLYLLLRRGEKGESVHAFPYTRNENSVQISLMGARDPYSWAITWGFPGCAACITQTAGNRSWNSEQTLLHGMWASQTVSNHCAQHLPWRKLFEGIFLAFFLQGWTRKPLLGLMKQLSLSRVTKIDVCINKGRNYSYG